MLSTTSLGSSSELIAHLQQRLREKEEILRSLEEEKRRRITGFINPGETEFTMSDGELKRRILERIEGVYDSISIEQLPHAFSGNLTEISARKITLKRTTIFLDVFPMVAFFSALIKDNSIYRRTIDESVIPSYVLCADDPGQKDNLDRSFDEAKKAFTSYMLKNKKTRDLNLRISNLDHFRGGVEEIMNLDQDFKENEIYKSLKSVREQNDFTVFLNEYKPIFNLNCIKYREYLQAAYWQSKSIVIWVPNDLSSDATAELITEGFVTPWLINLAKFLRI